MSIFNCCEPPTCIEDLGDDVYTDQVDCFADLTLPQPGGVAAGTRFIVKNVEPIINIDPSWINLPSGLQENDIIEKDSQNLNWILATDVSAEGPGQLTYIKCKGFYYWWNGFSWMEISSSAFCGLCERDDYVPTEGQTTFTLSTIPVNPDKSILSVNQAIMQYGVDYIINGSQLEWVNGCYTLDPGDYIQIRYS